MSSESEKAVYLFKLECTFPAKFETHVQAFDENGDTIIKLDNITLYAVNRYNLKEIGMIWEDAGLSEKGFHALGLWGIYSTTYCQMKFLTTTKQLEIHSSNSGVVILVDSK